jgi:hypothetical protein
VLQSDDGGSSDSGDDSGSSAEGDGPGTFGADPGGNSSRMRGAGVQSDVGNEMYSEHFGEVQGQSVGGPSRFSALD